MLNIDPIVKVNVNVGTSTASAGVFDVGAILTATAGTANGTGGGDALSTSHRFASYASIAEVLNGVTNSAPSFGATTDVYKAAEKYFNVDPAPASLVVIYYDTAEQTTDTPTIAMLEAINAGAEFYSVYYSPKAEETATNIRANIISIASALGTLNRGVEFYGVTGTVASAVSGLFNDLMSTGSKRVVGMYCTTDTDDAAGLMGAAMGLSRTHENSSFALCYKSVASATVNNITQTEVDSIKSVNGNVFVKRTKTRAFVENGAVASGLRFDDVLYIDRMAHDIQVGLYELIANNPNKYPQTDSSTAVFLNTIGTILDNYTNMGVLATAQWRGIPIGKVATGDYIENGHTEFAESFDTQSEIDRAAHKAMPITILLCLAGSIETIVITVDVQT